MKEIDGEGDKEEEEGGEELMCMKTTAHKGTSPYDSEGERNTTNVRKLVNRKQGQFRKAHRAGVLPAFGLHSPYLSLAES